MYHLYIPYISLAYPLYIPYISLFGPGPVPGPRHIGPRAQTAQPGRPQQPGQARPEPKGLGPGLAKLGCRGGLVWPGWGRWDGWAHWAQAQWVWALWARPGLFGRGIPRDVKAIAL